MRCRVRRRRLRLACPRRDFEHGGPKRDRHLCVQRWKRRVSLRTARRTARDPLRDDDVGRHDRGYPPAVRGLQRLWHGVRARARQIGLRAALAVLVQGCARRCESLRGLARRPRRDALWHDLLRRNGTGARHRRLRTDARQGRLHRNDPARVRRPQAARRQLSLRRPDRHGERHAPRHAPNPWRALGCSCGCGTVCSALAPNGSGYDEQILYRFQGRNDGQQPVRRTDRRREAGEALYGTTYYGGTHGAGAVFKLTPAGSGYSESVLHSFAGGSDGAQPMATLVADKQGTLYGSTYAGGGAS